MSEAHKLVLEKANAAIVKLDFDGFLKFCTEDTTWTFEGDKVIKGKAAVREWMAATYVESPDFQVHYMIADGDNLAAVGEILLKDDQGKAVRHSYCDVWRFRGGLMAELHAFVVKRLEE
jgi:ketosteroid isomerase-like protein